MTFEIALVLVILVAALTLFLTEAIRMDMVALLVLATLALTGLVTTEQALSGFSSPAVVSVWAMYILTAGLTRTGVAEIIGNLVLRGTGRGETQATLVIAGAATVLSAFMSNVGVAALMLPAVITVARRSDIPPSRLLLPLAYGTMLGGLSTLIGTPPNLLISDALRLHGGRAFGMFDFLPTGAAVALSGILFLGFVGRHLLPRRDPAREASSTPGPSELSRAYRLDEQSALIVIPDDSQLEGRSLAESRLGSAARLNVFAIQRERKLIPGPGPEFVLRAGDRLLVEGKLDRFEELRGWSELVELQEEAGLQAVVSAEIGVREFLVAERGVAAGGTIASIDFRKRFGAIVLAMMRDGEVIVRDLARVPLRPGDRLLVQGPRGRLEALRDLEAFADVPTAGDQQLATTYGLRERLFAVRLPTDSSLAGKRLAESRLGDALGVGVMALQRGEELRLIPGPDERLQGDDVLFVRGTRADLRVFRGLQGLVLEREAAPVAGALQQGRAALIEALLSPRARLVGRTPSELRFRERYGLQLLAVLRRGEIHRSNLRDLTLEFGDALLLLGPEEKRSLLVRDSDFLLIDGEPEEDAPPAGRRKAPLAALIMVAVLVPVILGWLPIVISAIAGSCAMVLTGCLSMRQAHRAIEWRAIFLIAGMMPLGIALTETGAAALLAENLVAAVGPHGPWAVFVALYLMTAVATTIIPTPALVLLMTPIVLTASNSTGLSPSAAMMGIAMAASATFTSPVSHPANLLVMGPGGYRFGDYVRVGAPLAVVVFVVVLLTLPLFWPLTG